eukprot:555493-Rhodomonas_salina.2
MAGTAHAPRLYQVSHAPALGARMDALKGTERAGVERIGCGSEHGRVPVGSERGDHPLAARPQHQLPPDLQVCAADSAVYFGHLASSQPPLSTHAILLHPATHPLSHLRRIYAHFAEDARLTRKEWQSVPAGAGAGGPADGAQEQDRRAASARNAGQPAGADRAHRGRARGDRGGGDARQLHDRRGAR